MDNLPDVPLALVMQHLSINDLLACRLVSKRIGAAAVRPDAWAHRRLGHSRLPADANKCVCPVLRLAPRLDALGQFLTPRPAPCRLAGFPVRCAVAELGVTVLEDANASADTFELVRRQAALGRLRSLTLRLYGLAPGDTAVETVVSTPGLEHLDVKVHFIEGRIAELPAMDAPALHSVRHFECNLSSRTEPFVNSILAEHAATLERVNLLSQDHRSLLSSTAPLLAAMTHLRELECRALPGMQALAACESLRVLRLTVTTIPSPAHQAVAGDAQELLRHAAQLREVTLDFWPPVVCVGEHCCVGLIPALGTSRQAGVERLVVDNSMRAMSRRSEDPQLERFLARTLPPRVKEESLLLEPLKNVLSRLPALRHLSTDEDPDLLLPAINPASAPRLQSVRVTLFDDECAHDWIHGDVVKTVLLTNPSLHIEVRARTLCCGVLRRPSCERACALGCHQVLSELVQSDAELVEEERRLDWHLGLFSHDPKGECSLIHKTDRQHQRLWIHIP